MNQKKKHMPQLLIDEVLLLVDVYFQLKNVESKEERFSLVEELSKNLHSFPFYPEEAGKAEFRSVAGMKMCLANVSFADPEGRSKFNHYSALQRKVFEYYTDQREVLHNVAKSIVAVSSEKFPIDYSFQDSIFGMILPSYHLYIEKTNKTVNAVKAELKLRGQTCCRLCGRDLGDRYTVGNELLEIHVSAPLFKNNSLTVSPSDLLVLCPTCHKLAHSRLDCFEEENLKGYII